VYKRLRVMYFRLINKIQLLCLPYGRIRQTGHKNACIMDPKTFRNTSGHTSNSASCLEHGKLCIYIVTINILHSSREIFIAIWKRNEHKITLYIAEYDSMTVHANDCWKVHMCISLSLTNARRFRNGLKLWLVTHFVVFGRLYIIYNDYCSHDKFETAKCVRKIDLK